MPTPNEMRGAIDFDECPTRGIRCMCGICATCGFHKHMAVHGPIFGEPPGSEPYDHEFLPASRAVTPEEARFIQAQWGKHHA